MRVDLGLGSFSIALLQAKMVSQMREFHQARMHGVFHRRGTPARLHRGRGALNEPAGRTSVRALVRALNRGYVPPVWMT